VRNRNRTSEEKLWAALAHLMLVPVVMLGVGAPLLGILSLFMTILIYYFKRRTSPWIAFQGLQALTFQVITFSVFAPIRFFFQDPGDSERMSSPLYWQVLLILVFFYAVMGATRCALGYNFRYPFIGRPIQRRFRVNEE
jgi:uncharacterized Tic20 family protein